MGLTNLGTNCEDVVCKYEQVRELRFETAISFCILHFASCIFQNLPVAKTYFSKRSHKVELQLRYVGKSFLPMLSKSTKASIRATRT